MKRILLVGDSISLDYGPEVRKFVRSDIAVFSMPGTEEAYRNLDLPIGGNGGDSRRVLNYVTSLRDSGAMDFEWFFFNCGLHDIKRERPDENLQIGEEDYRANLQAIVDLMRENGVKTVFINTTQADGKRYRDTAPLTRRAEDVVTYNRIAKDVMEKNGVPIIDLFAFTEALGRTGNDLYRDHTHFLPDVITLHAAYVAASINTYV